MNDIFHAHWGLDWVWSFPLIVGTVLIHAFVLRTVNFGIDHLLKLKGGKLFHHMVSVVAVGIPALCATAAHGIEAWVWSLAYFFSGAISDPKAAMAYSLGAMTTFGVDTVHLTQGWQLLGPLEALSGWILFGLTTAFLFTIIRKVWATDEWV